MRRGPDARARDSVTGEGSVGGDRAAADGAAASEGSVAPGRAPADGVGTALDREGRGPDLGDLVVVLLAGTLAGLRDRLHEDGFADAAELVGDLVELADDYVTRGAAAPGAAA